METDKLKVYAESSIFSYLTGHPVKDKGGNPLDLHCDGIPHLFIVKADGTLLEEGHPTKLFTEEKLKKLK